jgi:dethiobiotin synthetase
MSEVSTHRQYDFFVTGTDTEIGKTFTSSALLYALAARGLSTVGMKPIAAGASLVEGVWHNDDLDSLIAASSVKAKRELICPYLMRTPAAPHIVAQVEGVEITPQVIQSAYATLKGQAEAVIVEGVGGFCVPLNAHYDTAHMARDLNLPVILVVGLRLGCINHALLTAQAIAAQGLRLVGWVANTVDPEMTYVQENIAALSERLPAPLLGFIPRMKSGDARDAAGCLSIDALIGAASAAI